MTHYTHKMRAVPMSGNIAGGPSCRLQPWVGGQSWDLAKVPACWLVPRLPLVAHVALLDYGIPPIHPFTEAMAAPRESDNMLICLCQYT